VTGTSPFPPAPGLYALLLHLAQPARLQIGARGILEFPTGSYLYAGSAKGPGGLQARLQRHLRPAARKKMHWHIDYLAAAAELQTVFWTADTSQEECTWAAKAAMLGRYHPPRFGASDCSCPGHLVALDRANIGKLTTVFIPPLWHQTHTAGSAD